MASLTKSNPLIDIMKSMDYGDAPESEALVHEWLARRGKKLGSFVNGNWQSGTNKKSFEVMNPCTGETLASVDEADTKDLDEVAKVAKGAFALWSKLSPSAKARHLYSIARHVQKHQQLLTVLDSVNTGRAIHEVKNHDIPQVVRCLYHFTGWAELMSTEMPGWKPRGVVAVILAWNFPLWNLVSLVAPAMAAGNTVIVKPATVTPLSALLFAEICNEAGLPPGVVNVINGSQNTIGRALASHSEVSQVSFMGSVKHGRELRQMTAGMAKKFCAHLSGKSAMLVFDSADLDAAVEGVIEGMFFNHGQVVSAASRLLIHEPVFDIFVDKLKARMKNIRIGKSLDKNIDLGTVMSDKQLDKIKKYVTEAAKEKAEVFQTADLHTPLTLITNINPTSRIAMEEVFGPVLVTFPFRTAKEAVALANVSAYGIAASVWSENMALCLEVAKSIAAANVWINCHNVFDAAAEFDHFRLSGYGSCGGKEGLYDFLQLCCDEVQDQNAKVNIPTNDFVIKPNGPSAATVCDKNELGSNSVPCIDATYKSYVGGSQKRPDGNCSRPIYSGAGDVLGHIPECNRKDVRDAVEAAQKAQPGWVKRTGHNRLQILYYIAENLQRRQLEFAKQLSLATGCSDDDAKKEVEQALESLFCWGSYCDKYGGEVRETNMYGIVYNTREAVGVIGIICPETSPFLPFVTLLATAICRGNTVVIVPSEKHPLAGLDFYQILDTSDVPAGVVNILTGDSHLLARQLASHQDVNAVWCFGSSEMCKSVEYLSADNMKRTWVNDGRPSFAFDSVTAVQRKELLRHVTKIKTIWMPMGESFAN